MIFLETSFIINFHVPKIQNHDRAKEIALIIKDKPKAISEMVIYETMTVLRKLNQNDEKLEKVYDYLINSQDITIFEDIIHYKQGLKDTFINSVGFFDNLSHVVMINNDIKKIATFDKDFHIFKDIKVID
ncbi:type II toxin-antitoxin system VapC family toxin [Methanobrevibacter filiformis]|uniref:tRNA(FMet)-specific endonuclease VapC n=1 Tax=Methanobrevibacter filiformis TaxID=55758 RepID=A0A166F0Q9_9EURY|nr:type II toxin-antitoxin system VapC family toxin [Methanobrevibacter filiformis]KZX17203.1 tRNA(fMet)-specific endonuclease VapC [Methanobrevibacter filiformis]